MKADWGTGAWLDGTPGPEIIEPLTPKQGDIILRGKLTLDAFHSTAINYILRANEIDTVAFCGFHTNWCVESSARSAYDHGFRVVVLSDCTATDTEREQKYAEEVIFPRIGKVMTAAQFLAALS
ncbi:MAG: cysteine hydrolase [Magnetospirillum sp.]|nr:cysteine hydrolase [Magnetospirillum sp.]